MPRGRKPKQRDINKELEALNAPVHPEGIGEDAPVKTLLSPEFTTMPDSQALDVALALQQIIRGQNSLLSNINKMGDEINKLRERMDKFDRAAMEWETDRKKFLEKINGRAENLRITDPDAKARFQAKAVKQIQDEIMKAKAERHVSDLQFEEFLKNQPQETIISKGEVVTINKNGAIDTEIIPEIIRIRNKVWVLPPNQPVLVPKLVADEWRTKQKVLMEQNERMKLLENANRDSHSVAQEWKTISDKYNSATDQFPEG